MSGAKAADMSFADLITWARQPNLSESDPKQGRLLVKAARSGLDEGDPRDDLLYDIEVELYEGKIPVALLRELEERFGDADQGLPYGNRLEIEYRRLAANLPEAEWVTTFYAQARQAAELAKAGQSEQFLANIHEMHEVIVKAWEPYARTSLTEEDVTAETVVGHLLLRDGVEGWLEALDQLERASREEMTYEEALATGEKANRLMISVQRLTQKINDSDSLSQLADSWS